MEEINIKDFLDFVLKKILIILLIGVLFAIITFIYSEFIKIPMYESNTTIVLTKTNNTESIIDQEDINMNQKLVSTYSELIKSKLVLNQVIDKLNLNIKYNDLKKIVEVENVQNTEIIKITVKYKKAKESSEIANTISNIFSKEIINIYEINNVGIVDKATVPNKVCNDFTLRDTFLAFIIGCILSILILLIIYYFDDTIKYSETLEEEFKLPIIGKIMLEKKQKNEADDSELIVNTRPKDLISEAIKSIRTNLSFSEIDNNVKTILMASTVASEGKSFISANLGVAFAQTGKTVLIVDCDMRKGRQHKIFKISNEKGFSDLIVDDINNFANYIRPTEVRKLFVLPCGTIPPNPSELLNSEKNRKLINLLKEKFDLIIFDGVPCNGLPDSIIMSTLTDKTILVSSEGVTPKKLLKSAIKDLESVKANIAGLVLNKVNMSGSYYTKYYSYYGTNK